MYIMKRARKYCLPGQLPGNMCVVIEIAPRDGATVTFRFPDADVRAVMDLQSRVFPSWEASTTTHFCGIPMAVRWAFTLCRPFMSAEAYGNMKLMPSFAHLRETLPLESIMPRWDSKGTFDFDLDAYVEWRAREEGIPPERLCRRGEGRAFTGSSQQASEDAMNGDVKRLSALELVGSDALASAESEIRKWGEIQKRGSGRGLFGNRKWKTKLLVLQGGTAVYFDETAVVAENLAARVIPLGQGCRVGRTPIEGLGLRGPSANLTLVTPGREYIFGCDSESGADEWVAALQTEIDAMLSMAAAEAVESSLFYDAE